MIDRSSLHLRLKGADATSGNAIRAVAAFADGAGLPTELRGDLLVIVDEVVSNTLKYGGMKRGQIEVEIRASIEGRVLELRFADNGRPFDPLQAAAPALDLPLARRPAGSLGIHLVRALTDTQRYAREGGCNVLVLTRSIAR
jgi:anti-sigma regulatory factor (Ser/Thr protein kinase)